MNLYVCLLSYLHFGRPRIAPREGWNRDRPLTDAQVLLLRGLWDDCFVIVRTPHKMGGRGAANLESTFDFGMHVSSSEVGEFVLPPPGRQGSAFRAGRAKLLQPGTPRFDPVSLLPVLEGATFLEPRPLEVSRGVERFTFVAFRRGSGGDD